MTEAPAAPRKRFVGRAPGSTPRAAGKAPAPPVSLIPPEIQDDAELNAAIAALLPSNYSFEVHKTIHQIRKASIRRVALQLPEGLSMWACALADLVERFTEAEAVVLGDVTYGACCVDDYTARALGCDMLVHYGHSCLIPIDQTSIKTLYVFVEIGIDRRHLAETVRYNFPRALGTSRTSAPIAIEPDRPVAGPSKTRLACIGTVQFIAAVQGLQDDLDELEADVPRRLALMPGPSADAPVPVDEPPDTSSGHAIEIVVPQIKPLSPGEVLGCTAPKLPDDIDGLLYVGDGRFHLESVMIANPRLPAFRYDPYEKRITAEGYAHAEMRRLRAEAVESARRSLDPVAKDDGAWIVVLGTLGRQGSMGVLKSVTDHLDPSRHIPLLLSELSPVKLGHLAPHSSVFVQTSCPRLSIDWGYAFPRPLLSPYEANIAMGRLRSWQDTAAGDYAMDFWADDSLGPWTPRHFVGIAEAERRRQREARANARRAAVSTVSVAA